MSHPNGEAFKLPHSVLPGFPPRRAFVMGSLTLCHSDIMPLSSCYDLTLFDTIYTQLAIFSSLQPLEGKRLLASHPSIAARKCHQDTESSPRVLTRALRGSVSKRLQ